MILKGCVHSGNGFIKWEQCYFLKKEKDDINTQSIFDAVSGDF